MYVYMQECVRVGMHYVCMCVFLTNFFVHILVHVRLCAALNTLLLLMTVDALESVGGYV